ncbi:hypothetical protein B7463_g11436, partial [Scytalidium lignicola]
MVSRIEISQESQEVNDETIRNRIEIVTQDLTDLNNFYKVGISEERISRFREYYNEQLLYLENMIFDGLAQQGRVDYLLLKGHLKRLQQQLELDVIQDKMTEAVLPFATALVTLIVDRQHAKSMEPKQIAQAVHDIYNQVLVTQTKVEKSEISLNKTTAYRAANTLDELCSYLREWYEFYNGYDPMFSWWLSDPYAKVQRQLEAYAVVVREKLVGIKPGDEDAIVGQPIGHDGLLMELEAEKINYTPEELICIGEQEYIWVETELKKVSRRMGFSDDWRKALEIVREDYVEVGQQTQIVREFSSEAINFVKNHDLVTVPRVAEEAIPIYMMAPARQKLSPFFLGGKSIIVSYPTDTMGHADKLMSLRGNNIHYSRATVFHELIPGHHLQWYMNNRYRPYRRIFHTPFWTEGWSLYWEFILWDDERFPKTDYNRVGMLFWRLHRCVRIIFSIKFHLGQINAQECVDMLVERGGHERATAEGEVRRSLNGTYSPLYQAGYMLGALQWYSLRQELVVSGKIPEKRFHDLILHNNSMPVEFARAILMNKPLKPDYKASWKFYNSHR